MRQSPPAGHSRDERLQGQTPGRVPCRHGTSTASSTQFAGIPARGTPPRRTVRGSDPETGPQRTRRSRAGAPERANGSRVRPPDVSPAGMALQPQALRNLREFRHAGHRRGGRLEGQTPRPVHDGRGRAARAPQRESSAQDPGAGEHAAAPTGAIAPPRSAVQPLRAAAAPRRSGPRTSLATAAA
jgi:hypothetical protein